MAGGRPHVPFHCAAGLADRVRRPDPWPSEGHELSAPGGLPPRGDNAAARRQAPRLAEGKGILPNHCGCRGRQPTRYTGTSRRATTSGRGTGPVRIGLSPRPAGGLPLGRPLLQVSKGRNQRRHSPLQRPHAATAARQPQGRLRSRHGGSPRVAGRQYRGRPLGQDRGHGDDPQRSGGPACARAGAPTASCRLKRRDTQRVAATPCSPPLPFHRRRPWPGPQRGRSPTPLGGRR